MMKDFHVSIVGRGNVGTHLQQWLTQKGIRVDIVNPHSPEELDPDTDICLISVSDSAIREVAERVDAILRKPDAVIAHTSGTTPLSAIATTKGAAVLYPMQTFTKGRTLDYSEIPLFIEGSDEASLDKIKSLALRLTEKVHCVDSPARARIHLGAVFACNFLNYMLTLADKSIKPGEKLIDIYEALIKETVAKALEMGPMAAQTGPARRNDRPTMEAHLDMLRQYPDIYDTYKLLSEQITSLYCK